MRRINSFDSDFAGAYRLWREQEGYTNVAKVDRMRTVLGVAMKNNLTSRQREAIDLYYIRGMKLKEISAMWGISVSAVSRHISRAKSRLNNIIIL